MPLTTDQFGIQVWDFEGVHVPRDTIVYINGSPFQINTNFRDAGEVSRAGIQTWYRAVNYGAEYAPNRLTILTPSAGVNCDAAYADGTIKCVDGEVVIREGTLQASGSAWKPLALRGPPKVVDGVNYWGKDGFDGTPALLFCPCKECDPFTEDCDEPNIPNEDMPDVEGTCECMAEVLGSIAELASAIRDKAECQVMDCKTILDECLEDIVKKVLEELEPTVTSCDDCCQKIRSGAEMAVADRIACATCECEEVKKECSMAGLQPGEKCDTCGQENCCCSENYTCEPCEEEGEDENKYYGYCNASTGQVIVLKGKDKPPSGPWRRLSQADESSIAYQEAVRLCVRQEPDKPPPGTPRRPSISGIPACDLNTFGTASNAGSFLQGALGPLSGAYVEDLVRSNAQKWFDAFPKPALADAFFASAMSTQFSSIPSAIELGPSIAKSLGCNENAFTVGLTGLSAIGLYQKWTGVSIEQFCDPLFYALNATCRRKQLGIDQAMAAYLANAIDDKELDTHWAIAGYCQEALINYKEAARAKPVPLQLAFMRRRKMISEIAYDNGMRRLGYLDSTDRSNLFTLTEQVPTQSDLIRMMVRDADNQNVVNRFGLDDGFENVFGGQLKEWAEWQGVSEQAMRYNWRAHWSIPSPTQLYNMLHRLPVLGGFGDKAKVLEDVEAALIQQDILPFWIPRLMAISYNPLTRIDVRRAYNIGAIDETAVHKSYLELGYDETNASALTEFTVRLRNESAVSHQAIKLWLKFALSGVECEQRMVKSGFPEGVVRDAMAKAEIGFESSHWARAFVNGELRAEGLSNLLANWGVSARGIRAIIDKLAWKVKTAPPLQQFIVGTIDRRQAIEELVSYGMAERRAVKVVMDVDYSIDKAGASACERGVKDRYLLGELTWEETVAYLNNYGIVRERAIKLANWWSCEKSSLGKAVTTNTLCSWAERGAISLTEFNKRLVSTGYSEDDSLRIIGDCSAKIGLKRANEAIKMAKEESAARRKAEADQRRAQAALEKESAKQKRQQEAAKKTRQNRQNALLKASAKLANACQCPLEEAFAVAREQYAQVQQSYGLTPDESLQVLIQATDILQENSVAGFLIAVESLAGQAASVGSGLQPSLPE